MVLSDNEEDDSENDGDEVKDMLRDDEMPAPRDTCSPQPSTSGFRPVLQSTGLDNIGPGVAERIKESMKEASQRVNLKRKRPAPLTMHFAITGNERLEEFKRKREEKEAKERQMTERKRVREEKKREKEEKLAKKKTRSNDDC